jgi:16S rRNA (guanine527-N7)-methyltransferase
MEWEELPGLFPGLDEPERWLTLLKRHAELVEEAAPAVRTSAVATEDVVRRQYAECLELWRIAVDRGVPEKVVDVGSGGGFPGLVIAAVAPGVDVTLVEPLRKRAKLLEAIAAQLGLGNVSVHAVRAEDAGRGALRESADLVTARALAPLAELLEYTAPLAAVGGMLALPKGSGAEDEVAAAAGALAELGCHVERIEPMRPEVNERANVVLVRKGRSTPERYPRRAGVPRKRPL